MKLFLLTCLASLAARTCHASDIVGGFSLDPTCKSLPYVNLGYFEENPFGACSGHGECVNVTFGGSDTTVFYQCKCDSGWTGRSDWVNGEGFDCGVNIVAVQGLWAVNLLVTLTFFVKSLPYMRTRYSNHTRTVEMAGSKGKKHSIRKNRGLLAAFVFLGFCTPAMVSFCCFLGWKYILSCYTSGGKVSNVRYLTWQVIMTIVISFRMFNTCHAEVLFQAESI
jgi:hypothetical protein